MGVTGRLCCTSKLPSKISIRDQNIFINLHVDSLWSIFEWIISDIKIRLQHLSDGMKFFPSPMMRKVGRLLRVSGRCCANGCSFLTIDLKSPVTYSHICIYIYNVKWGLIIPSRLINHHCPKKTCNLKTGGPPRLINRWAYPRLINHQCWNPFFYPTCFISNSIYFQLFFTFFNHHCYTSGLSWSLKISKNNDSPNDRFLMKIFIKNISLDSSQRVCPWLINHLSDPWNVNKSNGILLGSNWRKPYPKFYGSELLIKGCLRKWPTR